MSKYEVLIKAVTIQGLSYGEVARRFAVSKSLVHKLHHRWLVEGDAAFVPRSRQPRSSPTRIPQVTRDRIIKLRDELVGDGLDAGTDTIVGLLAVEGVRLSRATVWRVLTGAGASVRNHRSAPDRPGSDSRPTVRTSSGSPTSPT